MPKQLERAVLDRLLADLDDRRPPDRDTLLSDQLEAVRRAVIVLLQRELEAVK
jgi:hypothetical protein